MDKKKRSLEDIFILQQLQKIKDAKYYTSPIFTPEEWKQRYPHESPAEIPSYIPCWRDLDEIIYTKMNIVKMKEPEDELSKRTAKMSKMKEEK